MRLRDLRDGLAGELALQLSGADADRLRRVGRDIAREFRDTRRARSNALALREHSVHAARHTRRHVRLELVCLILRDRLVGERFVDVGIERDDELLHQRVARNTVRLRDLGEAFPR